VARSLYGLCVRKVNVVRQVCLQCSRSAPHQKLYCQETYCPAEQAPLVLDQGEWLGDIEVIRLLVVLPSSVVYVARQQQQQVLLKIAHPRREHNERLKREAKFLAKYSNHSDQVFLPKLLPPYVGSNLSQFQYGHLMHGDQMLYFCLFAYFEGESLASVLAQQPQPWINHVGWITLGLTSTLAYLHTKGLLHLALSPEAVLVRFAEKKKQNVPVMQLIDLGLASDPNEFNTNWYPEVVAPAYTAPELISNRAVFTFSTDVYGIGLILYELLMGKPRFPFQLRSASAIYHDVRTAPPLQQIERQDLGPIRDIALKTVHPSPTQRYEVVIHLLEHLKGIFKEVPSVKPSPQRTYSLLFVTIVLLLTLAFLIAVIATIEQSMALVMMPGLLSFAGF
jgi:serine/threonine protein kinase